MAGSWVTAARESLDRSLRARAQYGPPAMPDAVYVHPDTVAEVMKTAGITEVELQVHGGAAVLFGAAVIPTHQAVPGRFLWIWHAPALRGGPPGPPRAAA